MELLLSIIYGAVQAFTEFLPISSSAHNYLLFALGNKLSFDFDIILMQIALHLGTLFSIIIYFRKELILYIKKFFQNRSLPLESKLFDEKALYLILIGIIPIGIVGFLFEKSIETYIRDYSISIIPYTLIIGGILFLIAEHKSKQNKDLTNITWQIALLIGASQIIALIPGVSRSGITIITGLLLNLKRKAAAEFTFLLAIPTILGISLKKLLDISFTKLSVDEILVYIFACLSSAIIGYLVIKFFLKYLADNKLNVFAYYRFALAIVLLTFFYLI